jgi:hypothetical protein
MRIPRVLVASLGIFCFASAGHAQPDVLIAGQVASAIAYGQPGWCAVTQGSSAIQRNRATRTAVISFPELTLFDGSTYYLLNGQASLKFSSKTSGTISFTETAYGNTVISPAFNGYSETSKGGTYAVHFSITFANNCILPIAANFEAP